MSGSQKDKAAPSSPTKLRPGRPRKVQEEKRISESAEKE
jgi:hypothetical protein